MAIYTPSTPIYPIGQGAAYSITTASGTNTLKAGPGIYYGASVVTAGTASTFSVSDGTTLLTTATNQSAGLVTSPFPSGVGVVFNTSLVVVTAGIAVSTTAFLFQ